MCNLDELETLGDSRRRRRAENGRSILLGVVRASTHEQETLGR